MFQRDPVYIAAEHGQPISVPEDLDRPDESSALNIPQGGDEKIAPAQNSEPPRVVSEVLANKGKRQDVAYLQLRNQILKLHVKVNQQSTINNMMHAISSASMDPEGTIDAQGQVTVAFEYNSAEKKKKGFFSKVFSSDSDDANPIETVIFEVRKLSDSSSVVVVLDDAGGLRSDAIAESALSALIPGLKEKL